MAKKNSSGPRGLSKEHLVEKAVVFMEEVGASAFTLRKLGAQVGCDPMSILYHFGSKEGLLHAMADWLESQIVSAPLGQSWEDDLRHLAVEYRGLGLRYPKTFWIMQHFFQTGLSDFGHMESVYGALRTAGVPDSEIPAVCLGWYVTMTGLAMAEVGGLVRPPTERDIAEIEQLPEGYPLLQEFLPHYRNLASNDVFATTVEIFLQGVRMRNATPSSHNQEL